MNSRKLRLPEIIDIIANNDVASQEDLSKLLAVRGFIVTQATLSRDLKMLKATKISDERGGYRYEIAAGNMQERRAIKASTRMSGHSAVLSIARSGNLCVIKTRNGYASGLAYDIDTMESPLVLGSIPGADTVFLAISEGATNEALYELLKAVIPVNILDASNMISSIEK